MAVKKRSDFKTGLINEAIDKGVEAIVKAHPALKDNEEYITRHINPKRLKSGLREISEDIDKYGKNWSEEERSKFVYENVASYVASGRAFDDKGQGRILIGGLSEKSGYEGKRDLESEIYVEKACGAFRDIYKLMKERGDMATRMPDFAEAVETIDRYGFLNSAFDVLDSYGLLDDRERKEIKKELHYKIKEGLGKASVASQKELYSSHKEEGQEEKIISRRRVAAAILGGIGLGAFFASVGGLTGGVIGVSGVAGNSVVGIAGLLLVIGAWSIGFGKS
jgi:hypothetical protein